MVFKLRSSNPCRSFSCDNSEFTQQDDRKKKEGRTLVCDRRDVSGLLNKTCLKEGEVRRKSFFEKFLSRLSHKVCLLLSSPVLLRKLTFVGFIPGQTNKIIRTKLQFALQRITLCFYPRKSEL